MNIKDEVTIRKNIETKYFITSVWENVHLMKKARPNIKENPKFFFITATFNDLPQETYNSKMTKDVSKKNFYTLEYLISTTQRRQSDFNKYIINQIVPSNHYKSRKKDYPVFFSFIDLAGSRFSKHQSLKIPHTHSLCIVPAKSVSRFEALAKEKFRVTKCNTKTKHIQTTDCQAVPADNENLYKVLDYSSKYYQYSEKTKFLPEETRSLLFMM